MGSLSAALPRLKALETYVRALPGSQAFWSEHFGLTPDPSSAGSYNLTTSDGDGVIWRLLPGALPCGTRGPHGALPAFQVTDFGQARGYLLAHDIPIVFEEILPGMSLLIFLDPDSTPIELSQATDPCAWDIADRRILRMKRRRDAAPPHSLHLGPVDEITLYTHDITGSVQFYRDLVGLPVGLSFFGHIHLVADNVPLVLRGVNWRCKTPGAAHATEPVFAVPDLPGLAQRLQAAGYSPQLTATRLSVWDPAGWRVHFEQ